MEATASRRPWREAGGLFGEVAQAPEEWDTQDSGDSQELEKKKPKGELLQQALGQSQGLKNSQGLRKQEALVP